MCFEQLPLSMVYTFCIWRDATKPCPQRKFWQATCGDSSCQNCGHAFLDIADLDLQYLSGELAVELMTHLPAKGGRRRALLSNEHCQMTVDDLDMARIQEYNTGNYKTLKIF